VVIGLIFAILILAIGLNSYKSGGPTNTTSITSVNTISRTSTVFLNSSSTGLGSATSSFSMTTNPSGTPKNADYVTSSAPNSSQWLILSSPQSPVQVLANNSGPLPEYSSEASLNQTFIGEKCVQLASNGECNSFRFISQTGWFFDSSSDVLFIHYIGGPLVEITVNFPQNQ